MFKDASAPPAIASTAPHHRVGAIGIGAQKCASSWLHAVAGSHPEISVADPKELDFFSYYFDRGYRWYESHFAPASDDPILRFECSPSYFHDPRSAQRVHAYNPGMKVVLLLRDPIKRAFSNHLHEIIKGHIGPVSFEDGLANNPSYLEQGMYARHLRRWHDAFGPAHVHVMFAEEIAADAGGSAQSLYGFLGVDPTFNSAILHERRNESDRPRVPILRHGLRAGGDWMRRKGREPLLARIKATAAVSQLLNANRINVRDEIPPMRLETVSWLRECFEEEMAALRTMLDLEKLPWEKGPEPRLEHG
jgi:hypothetical protein